LFGCPDIGPRIVTHNLSVHPFGRVSGGEVGGDDRKSVFLTHMGEQFVRGDAYSAEAVELLALRGFALLLGPPYEVMFRVEVEAAGRRTLHDGKGAYGTPCSMLLYEGAKVYRAIDICVVNEECVLSSEEGRYFF
jgi:hypothetical protein